MVTRLEYQPQPTRARPSPWQTVGRLALFTGLVLAVAYLFLLHVEPGAPFRQGGRPSAQESFVDNLLTAQDSAMQQVAGAGDVELHFAGSAEDRGRQAVRLTATYYNWNYLRYPQRVIVGKGDAIINSADQLFAADHVPDDQWLHTHGITSVITLTPGPGGELALDARTKQ